MLISFWRGSIYNFENHKISKNIGLEKTVFLKILEDPDLKNSDEINLRGEVEEISNEKFRGKIFVNIKTQKKLRRSDRILVKGKISKGFGDFSVSLKRGRLIKITPESDLVRDLRDSFADGIRKFIPSPEVDLGLGYLLGQKNSLPEQLTKALTITALTHIVVASGYNLTVLASAAQRLLNRFSRKIALFLAVLLVFGFMLIVGFTPSMTRAGMVSAIGLLLWYFGRKSYSYFLIILVAAITVIISPANLLNLGWQLSFASFFGVLVVSPLLQEYFFENSQKLNAAFKLFFETLSAQIATLPLIIFNFGAVSMVSIIANMLVLPFVPIAMLFVFLTGVSSSFSPLAQFFGFISDLILKYSIFIIEWFSKIKGAQIEFKLDFSGLIIFYGCLIAVVAFLSVVCYKDRKHNIENTLSE